MDFTNEYVQSACTCIEALGDFSMNINDFLPDYAGSYLAEWYFDDCQKVQNLLDLLIDTVLSTKMAEHVSYEMHSIQNAYHSALGRKNIEECKNVLNQAMQEFSMLHKVCRKIHHASRNGGYI